jgi:CBS domain-containing protein
MPNRKAEDIMTREVVTFTPETDLYEAMSVLLARKFSGASVVDSAGTLVGVLSEKDCLRVIVGEVSEGLPEGRVGDYMSRDLVTVSPSTSLFDVAALFLERHVRRLPVVEEGARLVGQISRRDVLWAIDSMRKHYLYPKQEHKLDTTNDGLGGVSSAMAKARGL